MGAPQVAPALVFFNAIVVSSHDLAWALGFEAPHSHLDVVCVLVGVMAGELAQMHKLSVNHGKEHEHCVQMPSIEDVTLVEG
jgi:hypothetical protein